MAAKLLESGNMTEKRIKELFKLTEGQMKAIKERVYNCIGDLAEGDGILYDLIEFIPIEKFEDKALADSLPQITL